MMQYSICNLEFNVDKQSHHTIITVSNLSYFPSSCTIFPRSSFFSQSFLNEVTCFFFGQWWWIFTLLRRCGRWREAGRSMDEFEWWRLDHLREGRLPASGGSERCCFFSHFCCWCDVFEETTTKKSHLKTQNPHKLHFFLGPVISAKGASAIYYSQGVWDFWS